MRVVSRVGQQQQQGMFLHRLAALCYVMLSREGALLRGVRGVRSPVSQLGVACYIIIETIAKEKEQNLHFDKLFCFCFGSSRGYDGVKRICLVSLCICMCA